MPVDPDKRIASKSSDMLLHMTNKEKKSRVEEPRTDHQANEQSSQPRSHRPAEMEKTSRLPKDDLESLEKDMNEVQAEHQQLDQLLDDVLEAMKAGKAKVRELEDITRDVGGRKEELEKVLRAQGTKISELFAAVNKKDAELAEVCIASWVSKERIWELEVDLKSKEHRLKQASDEAKELREEPAKLQIGDSEDKSRELAAECAEVAFSACVNLIKGRYPQLDVSFCNLGAALKAQQQSKS